MAKYFYNFLAGHHFLHERLSLSQRDLLAQKIFGGTVRNGPCCKRHADNSRNNQQGKDGAVVHHNPEHDEQRYA